MAQRLQDKPRTQAPDSDYPYGRIKDDTGINDGTPVDRELYGDIHQFFARMGAYGGISYNGLPDNQTNGFQYMDAFLALRTKVAHNFTVSAAITIGTGSKSLQVDSWLGLKVGQFIAVCDASAPTTNYMLGRVTTYSGTTLTVNVLSIGGSGSFTNFLILPGWYDIATQSEVNTGTEANKTVTAATLANSESVVGNGNAFRVVRKSVDIGDWDMDNAGGDGSLTKSTAHGLSATEWKTVRNIQVMIRDDADAVYKPLNSANVGGSVSGGVVSIDATNINLVQAASGVFDDSDYDTASSYNRGWITFDYTPA